MIALAAVAGAGLPAPAGAEPQFAAALSTQATPEVFPFQAAFDVATVTGAPGATVPTGTVTFRRYGDEACSNLLFVDPDRPLVPSGAVSAQASSREIALPVGTHFWRAFYNGDANYAAISAPCGEPGETTTVRPAVAQLSVSVTPRAELGRAVQATAVVTGPGPPLPPPTGFVDFSLFSDEECSQPAFFSQASVVETSPTQAQATSAPGVPSRVGTYYWRVTYASSLYGHVSAPCGPTGPTSVILPNRVVTDFDGDLRTDLGVFRRSTATWFISKFGATAAGQFGLPGDLPVPRDYDGDGYSDIGVFRPSTGTWFYTTRAGFDTAGNFGVAGDVPVPADYDGDGQADLAVFRPNGGMWFVDRSTGGTLGIRFGSTGDVPVPADYDGDGTVDPAVFRPGTATWFIRKSTGVGGGFGEVFGSPGDVPVPGDYDGDGSTDLAVFRRASATWFVKLSGGGGMTGNFGTSGDIPVPGDYDGDALTDVAVFRPTTATWFIDLSNGGTVAGSFGVAGDVPLPLPAAIRTIFFPEGVT